MMGFSDVNIVVLSTYYANMYYYSISDLLIFDIFISLLYFSFNTLGIDWHEFGLCITCNFSWACS